MERQQKTRTIKAYYKISRPWLERGLEAPRVSVKELSRTSGIDPSVMARGVREDNLTFGINGSIDSKLRLETPDGSSVEEIEQDARNAAPRKRAEKEARYQSRAPGGGPVVKSGLKQTVLERKLLELGTGKLKVSVENYDPEEERKKRRAEIAEKVRERRTIENPLQEIITSYIAEIRSMSERRGLANAPQLKERVRKNLRENETQTLLTIWGPPYEGQAHTDVFLGPTPEAKMANEIEDVISRLSSLVSSRLIILYADFYGTEVNGMPSEQVRYYGNQIQKRFQNTAKFIPWSKLRLENNSDYNEILRALKTVTPDSEEVRKARIVQEKLGYQITEKEAVERALKYRQERIIEGKLLTMGFVWQGARYNNIIKLGTAPNRFINDEPYEPELPRFYVSGMTRAAWNKKR